MIIKCPNIPQQECIRDIIPTPRTAFLIVHSPENPKQEHKDVIAFLKSILKEFHYKTRIEVEDSRGGDILCSICAKIQSTPLSIVIYTQDSPKGTVANLFLECGLSYGFGRETIILIEKGVEAPSDLSRSKYIRYDTKKPQKFKKKLRDKIKDIIEYVEVLEKFGTIAFDAGDLEKAAEYYKMCFLILGDHDYHKKLKEISKLLEQTTVPKEVSGLRKRLKENLDKFLRLSDVCDKRISRVIKNTSASPTKKINKTDHNKTSTIPNAWKFTQ